MKTFNFKKAFSTVIAGVGLLLATLNVGAENSTANAAPQLAYGVPQILKLAQAKVTDDVIIAYIHNTGNSYGLDADQIIYLREQGISDKVLTTMLAQPRPASVPAPAAAAPANSYVTPTPIAYAPPAPAYDQTVPSSSVYVIPNNQVYYYSSSYYPFYYPYYYYPYYPYYRRSYAHYHPYGSFSVGFHGGYHGGGYANIGVSYHGGSGFASVGGSFHGGGMMMHH